MEKVTVSTIELPPLPTNCYVVHSRDRAVVIDPGGIADPVVRFLEERGLALTHILLTHLHSDHTVGAGPLARRYAAAILASQKDGWMLDDYLGKGDDDWGIPPVEPFVFTPLAGGELLLPVGACLVLETPGHSPGGLCFHFPELRVLFSGDTLFRRTAGRTDFAGGDPAALEDSLRGKLFPLPGATRVLPGHGKAFALKDCLVFTGNAD